ncbi:MAG TPA: ABC transporter ATP-binding protein [Candidatus Acidoferrales bacterium]|nr:ABC transporter ATP-binding protein [Candidatus Acidoferrales bacterium]
MKAAAIALDELTKQFGQRTVVDAVTFAVPAGSIFGLLGPNGSGKSTTIKMLCGLVRPTSGTGSIDGLDIVAQSAAIRWHIGYMAQSNTMYEDLTTDENLEFYARAYRLGVSERRARKRTLVELMGLEPLLSVRSSLLSGGWQRRLALACALLHDPPIVFLDEPTAGIDPVARRELWDLFFRLAEIGKTFFVTTHYMDEAERCSEVGYLYNGKLIACGTSLALRRLALVNRPDTVRYAIVAEEIMPTFAAVRALPYVRDATIFGHELHVVVEAEASMEQLASDLRGYAPAEAIRCVDPSLEDVFVTLTRESA